MALRILQWNCRSIQYKIPELQSCLATLAKLLDILCLQETYLTTNIIPVLAGYKFIRKNRSNGKSGGGICICIKQSIPFSEVVIPDSQSDIESMVIKVSDIVISNVYNPPTNLIDDNVLLFVTKFRKSHYFRWLQCPPQNVGYGVTKHQRLPAVRFSWTKWLFCCEHRSTNPYMTLNAELKCSLIDLTLCSLAISHKCHVEVIGKFLSSDRCLIFLQVNSTSNASPSEWTPRCSFSRADWISFYHLCNAEITMNLFSTNTQLFYYRLTSTIFSIAERTFPRTKPCNKVTVPWRNKSCQIAINNKKHVENTSPFWHHNF